MIPEVIALAVLVGPGHGAGHPLALDRTGIAWVYPFEKARRAARERKRLLAVKPVAFGTTPDGGW